MVFVDLNIFFQLFIFAAYEVERLFSSHSYFVLPLRACNLTTVAYLITDNMQQINKICSLVYYLNGAYFFFSVKFSICVNLCYKLNSGLSLKEL